VVGCVGWGGGVLAPSFAVAQGAGVTAFGVNSIVCLPLETGFHYLLYAEELYSVHRGTVEMSFRRRLGAHAVRGRARPRRRGTVRKLRNFGDVRRLYLCSGCKTATVWT